MPSFPRTVVLWTLRIGLLGAVVLHIHAAYTLTLINRHARGCEVPDANATTRPPTSPAERCDGPASSCCCSCSGTSPTSRGAGSIPGYVRGDVYRNVDASLSRVPVAALYVVANIALGVHLYHGAWSLFQSMGWNHPRFNVWRRWFAIGFATLIVVGNVSFPIAVLAGIVES